MQRKLKPAEAGFQAEKTVLECLTFVADLKCQADRKETVKTYRNAYVQISRFLQESGLESLPVSKFGISQAQAYMDSVRVRVGNNTYNNYRGQAIVLFNAMRDRGMIVDNPFLKTPKVPKAKKGRRPFSAEEATAVLNELYEKDYWLLILVLMHLGELTRRTEAFRLRFCRFHLQQGYLLMTEEDTKNRKESIVTIPREVLPFFLDERFTRWPANYLIFGAAGQPHPSKSAGEGTYRLRHNLLLRRLKAAGKLGDITGLSLYSWKDTGMTFMAKHLTPFQLRDHARHQSTDMSLRYYHAEHIIPEVSEMKMPFLSDVVAKQKERLREKKRADHNITAP